MSRHDQTSEPHCLICFKPLTHGISLKELLFSQDVLCGVCRERMKPDIRSVSVMDFEVSFLYPYTDEVSKTMFRIKEARDVTLAPVFITPKIKALRKRFKNKTLVMVPSSASKTRERGFHALSEMFKPLGLPLSDCFIKDDIKQSSMHRDARKDIASHIRLKEPLSDLGDIVLIDDVCTTGKSLEACKRLLDPYTNHMDIFTLSIHSSWLKTK